MLFQKEKGLPLFGCHLDLTIRSVCTLAWKQGSALHPSRNHQGRAMQMGGRKDEYLCKEVFLQLFWDTLCFLSQTLLHPPLAPPVQHHGHARQSEAAALTGGEFS